VIDFQNGRGADGQPNNRFVAVRELKITGLRAPSIDTNTNTVSYGYWLARLSGFRRTFSRKRVHDYDTRLTLPLV
jgi:hypothetical protein